MGTSTASETTTTDAESVEQLVAADFVRDELRETSVSGPVQQGEVSGFWAAENDREYDRRDEEGEPVPDAQRLSESDRPHLIIHIQCPDESDGFVWFNMTSEKQRRRLKCFLRVLGTTGHELGDIVGKSVPMVVRNGGWRVPYRRKGSEDVVSMFWRVGHPLPLNPFIQPDYTSNHPRFTPLANRVLTALTLVASSSLAYLVVTVETDTGLVQHPLWLLVVAAVVLSAGLLTMLLYYRKQHSVTYRKVRAFE
jgi:hypothetical protein